MSAPSIIELTPEQIQAIKQRLESQSLQDDDYQILLTIFDSYCLLEAAYREKSDSVKRLLRLFFGAKTEKSKKILGKDPEDKAPEDKAPDDKPASSSDPTDQPPEDEKKKKRKGHGKNGADAHSGAERIKVPHETLKPGDSCLECPKGKVYLQQYPAKVIRFTGQPPITCKIYELERLRCNLCGRVFTAQQPEDAKKPTYDEKAVAMMGCLKYGSGMPFYRVFGLQGNCGILLPPSNQWEALNTGAFEIQPVFAELIRLGADGTILHHDDTTAKILQMIKANDQDPTKRQGIFTTGMVCIAGSVKIALFFTGSKHAGENMADLLRQRADGLSPPTLMCDALSRNIPANFEVVLANCLTHGRRKFTDILDSFPTSCTFVIEQLAEVYKNDAVTKDRNLNDVDRLAYHQQHSRPVMDALHTWLEDQFTSKKVEPNSSLGKAIKYMLKHWKPLTLFLRVPGAPLDNNIVERALKRVVLHRKNAYFFKTQRGAEVGDLYMSLIHTCSLNKVNPFDYLSNLLQNASRAALNPSQWLPWNYKNNQNTGNASLAA
jgi:transposase